MKKINVNQDGDFIFAFGRKFKEKLKITVNGINNEFDIIDKKYKRKLLEVFPKEKVEPNTEDLKKIKADQLKIKSIKKIGVTKNYLIKNF